MASASSASCSASTFYPPFDVFLNHRGPDVKDTFAARLYRELNTRGLQVFLDRPELKPGHGILSQIEAAIQDASVHIAIFSPTYAESVWCLDELVLMLKSKGIIIPVFYKVKPFELRWTDKGAYAKALQQHEKKQRYDLKTTGDWRKALSHAADISGFELEACNGDEMALVEKVVERVFEVVPKQPLYVAKIPIGLQEKLQDFERTVLSRLEADEGPVEAKVVGIVGTGGIGKSTLAKDFFNKKRSNYSAYSFLADVREKVGKKIKSLQKKLIKDLTGRDIRIDSWEEGIGILQNNLKSCRALIILDNIDHRNQLDAFLPLKHVLDPKSLILVTSRNRQILLNAAIENSSIYQLEGLDRAQSRELFCSHAFYQKHPEPEFVELVEGFLNVCDGLPLSLEVFGALLYQAEKSCWEEQLNGLEKLPNEIQVRLKISYDSLEAEEQQMFLDIAWFARGDDQNKWIRIWGWLGCKGSMALRNLKNKCLVEVDGVNKIRMHDHLRDMGRSIALGGSIPRHLLVFMIYIVFVLLEESSSCIKLWAPYIIIFVSTFWRLLARDCGLLARDCWRMLASLSARQVLLLLIVIIAGIVCVTWMGIVEGSYILLRKRLREFFGFLFLIYMGILSFNLRGRLSLYSKFLSNFFTCFACIFILWIIWNGERMQGIVQGSLKSLRVMWKNTWEEGIVQGSLKSLRGLFFYLNFFSFFLISVYCFDYWQKRLRLNEYLYVCFVYSFLFWIHRSLKSLQTSLRGLLIFLFFISYLYISSVFFSNLQKRLRLNQCLSNFYWCFVFLFLFWICYFYFFDMLCLIIFWSMIPSMNFFVV